MPNTFAKYASGYAYGLAPEQENPLYKPFFFSVPNYRETNAALESIFSLQHPVFAEITYYNKHQKSFEYLWDESPDLALCLSTISCYTSDLAHIFANSLNDRLALNGKKSMEITTCLQEAIMNSMFHGNLKMQSDFRTTKGLYAYQEEIKKRMMMDDYRFSTVNIKVWNQINCLKISVKDEGEGFSIPTYEINDKLPNGRGLMLIKSLADNIWVGEDKRTLFMTFNY